MGNSYKQRDEMKVGISSPHSSNISSPFDNPTYPRGVRSVTVGVCIAVPQSGAGTVARPASSTE